MNRKELEQYIGKLKEIYNIEQSIVPNIEEV